MAKPTLSLPRAAAPNPPQVQATAPVVVAIIQAPYLGASVLVKTSEKISGQNEHAAMITQLLGDDVVNVTLFPGNAQPYPIGAIRRADKCVNGALSWRWPN